MVLQVSLCTASEFLRSEIGVSRDITNKISFLKHSLQDKRNKLLDEIILKDIQNSETNWTKIVITYMNTIKLNLNLIKTMTYIYMITNKIYEWDKNQWYKSAK